MEGSVGGSDGRGYRPTLNSYQYGELKSLSIISEYLDHNEDYFYYKHLAQQLQINILTQLWDSQHQFFKVLPLTPHTTTSKNNKLSFVNVKELHGFTPWYFHLFNIKHNNNNSNNNQSNSMTMKLNEIENNNYNHAWSELMNSQGFYTPYGLTTAEQRHSQFSINYNDSHECLWNGPVWPYATSMTLTALSNLLQQSNPSTSINNNNALPTTTDYYNLLLIYAKSHQISISQLNTNANNNKGMSSSDNIPWIDENLDPYTG